jgi:hypothetical protein
MTRKILNDLPTPVINKDIPSLIEIKADIADPQRIIKIIEKPKLDRILDSISKLERQRVNRTSEFDNFLLKFDIFIHLGILIIFGLFCLWYFYSRTTTRRKPVGYYKCNV